MTKFLLDSGDPEEYKKLVRIAQNAGSQMWGSTTNPSLIAKKLAGKKLTVKEAFALQKDLVLEILSIVTGAVSAEVYSDKDTTADAMIEQGKEIATWHERVVVKLPTTLEGFKARTTLRKEKIMTNNTLVFSQEQIFAICLHEHLIQKLFGPTNDLFPPFISPFVGRLDDIGEDGMSLVEHGMRIKDSFTSTIWMLEASVRTSDSIKRGIDIGTELITAPMNIYETWFAIQDQPLGYTKGLTPLPIWTPSAELLATATIEEFMSIITSKKLNITHPLTEKGIVKFVEDWKAILI
ncbi:MAG: hypothetical protein KBD46_03575 [Candidatus Levybacteria bacterium]|nr:hypothetical protein [Candidatus Levybacteria bacterium]